MKELLKKLFEAEILTEDTRVELEAAFATQLKEAEAQAREEAHAAVTAELYEQWSTDRAALIEALDARITEALKAEISELHEDIERFRDLEVEYDAKLVEARADMATRVRGDMEQLIENINNWMEIRLVAELAEFREDIEVVRKQEFGRRVFESFVTEFKQHYAADGSAEKQLQEAQTQLADATAALEAAEDKAAKLERSMKMEQVLKPLSGKQREVMEAILKTVDTTRLEEAYTTYVGRVLKEAAPAASVTPEKEIKVLAEGKKEKTPTGVVKTGDSVAALNEAVQDKQPTIDADFIKRIRTLGGVSR